jgi:hypothetical protein
MELSTLISIGGREWKKDALHRVYFNNLDELFGLTCSYYNTGNISGARLDGETISNSRAGEIARALGASKVWYDVPTGKFMYRVVACRTYSGETMGNAIVDEIKARVAAAEQEAA